MEQMTPKIYSLLDINQLLKLQLSISNISLLNYLDFFFNYLAF